MDEKSIIKYFQQIINEKKINPKTSSFQQFIKYITNTSSSTTINDTNTNTNTNTSNINHILILLFSNLLRSYEKQKRQKRNSIKIINYIFHTKPSLINQFIFDNLQNNNDDNDERKIQYGILIYLFVKHTTFDQLSNDNEKKKKVQEVEVEVEEEKFFLSIKSEIIYNDEEMNNMLKNIYHIIIHSSSNERGGGLTKMILEGINVFLIMIYHIYKGKGKGKGIDDEKGEMIGNVLERIVKWYEIKRVLYAESLKVLKKKIYELEKFKKILLDNEKEKDKKKVNVKEGYELVRKMMRNIIVMYFPMIICSKNLFYNFDENGKSMILSYLSEIEREKVEGAEKEEEERVRNERVLSSLICIGMIIGKERRKKIKKFLLDEKNRDLSGKIMMVVTKRFNSKDEGISSLSVYIYREVFRIQMNDASEMDNVLSSQFMLMLDKSDSVSKAICILIAENALKNEKIIDELFEKSESNKIKRENALKVLEEISKISDKVLSKRIADHLLKRLHDEELSLRIKAVNIFLKLDPCYIIPKLVFLSIHENVKTRSAAFSALEKVLCNLTDSIIPINSMIDCVLYDSSKIKSPNDVNKQKTISKDEKKLSDKVFSLIPKWGEVVSINVLKECVESIIEKMFNNPQEQILVKAMNKFGEIPNIEKMKDLIFKMINDYYKELSKTQTKESESVLVFQRLCPLLILKILPNNMFSSSSSSNDNEKEDRMFFDHKYEMIKDVNEFYHVRVVCAEVCSKFPFDWYINDCLIEIPILLERKDYCCVKLLILLLCNTVLCHKKEFFKKYWNSLFGIIEEIIRMKIVEKEFQNLQTGCYNFIAFCIRINFEDDKKFEVVQNLNSTTSKCSKIEEIKIEEGEEEFDFSIVNILLSKFQNEKTSIVYKVGISNIFTMSCKNLNLSSTIILSPYIIPPFIKKIYSNDDILKIACLQTLLHFTVSLGSAIHPYTKDLLSLTIYSMKNNHNHLIRMNSIKLLFSIFSSRVDCVVEYQDLFSQILKELKKISAIDQYKEVRLLAEKLLKIINTKPKQ